MRRVDAILVWPGLFPQAPAQPGLSSPGADCANSGITESGASSCLLYTETQRWRCGLLIFFFPSHACQEVEGIGGGFRSLLHLPGIFPDNLRLCWYFGVRNGGGSVQVTAWGPGLLPHQFASSQWVDPELVPELEFVCASGRREVGGVGHCAPETVLQYRVPPAPGNGPGPTFLSHSKISVLVQKAIFLLTTGFLSLRF